MKSNSILQPDGGGPASVGRQQFPDPNNNSGDKDKYKLRPRATSGRSASSDKPPRTQPLSKYRRRTANARERSRMREINSAFEALRRCVPGGAGAPTVPERLTKISTLRLATQYIAALAAALATPQPQNSDLLQGSCCSSSLQGSDPFDLVVASPSSAFSSSDIPDTFCSASMSSDFSLSPDFNDDSLSFDPFLADFS